MTSQPVEDALSRLVTDLRYEQISAEALMGAKRLIQDQLGLQLGCATLPWNQATLQMTRAQHSPGRARVVGSSDRFCAADAAFVNATCGHSFEYDDAHAASLSHPGSCVVPAALAVGEEDNVSVGQVLEAIVAGYEVYTRIGTLASPDLLVHGFHPHSVLSPFGAAAVVAKLRGFDAETTGHALAIALSHCAGTTEYTSSGGSIKRVHSGIGTRNGIQAARMAEAGITGPTAFLTGGKGFFRTFVRREPQPRDADTFSLSQPFEIAGPLFKPYCCCGFIHAFIDGAREFSDRAEQIEQIELRIRPGGDVVVGNQNRNAWAPEHIEHLQYSLPFQFALAALGIGNGYQIHRAYLDGRVHLGPDSAVARLAAKVRITPDPDLDRTHPDKMVAGISITFSDGDTQHRFVEDSIGSAGNPMSENDLDTKFRDLTATALNGGQQGSLLEAIKTLQPNQSISELTTLLSTDSYSGH